MTVANGGLCLNGEEEGRDEAVDIVDARCPRLIFQMVQITPWGENEMNVWESDGGEGDKVGVKRGKIESEKIYIFRGEVLKYTVCLQANSSLPLYLTSPFS